MKAKAVPGEEKWHVAHAEPPATTKEDVDDEVDDGDAGNAEGEGENGAEATALKAQHERLSVRPRPRAGDANVRLRRQHHGEVPAQPKAEGSTLTVTAPRRPNVNPPNFSTPLISRPCVGRK